MTDVAARRDRFCDVTAWNKIERFLKTHGIDRAGLVANYMIDEFQWKNADVLDLRNLNTELRKRTQETKKNVYHTFYFGMKEEQLDRLQAIIKWAKREYEFRTEHDKNTKWDNVFYVKLDITPWLRQETDSWIKIKQFLSEHYVQRPGLIANFMILLQLNDVLDLRNLNTELQKKNLYTAMYYDFSYEEKYILSVITAWAQLEYNFRMEHDQNTQWNDIYNVKLNIRAHIKDHVKIEDFEDFQEECNFSSNPYIVSYT